MRHDLTAIGILAWVGAAVAAPAASTVQLRISDGRVWLVANDATVGQILSEWSRVGGTRVVNAERVPGGPLTLQLNDVTEQQALDLILRAAGGFIAMARPAASGTASRFAQILIMPVGAPASVRPAPSPAAALPPPEPAAAAVLAPGVRPVLGPDGQPVPDDQQDAPGGAPPRPTFSSMPPGFSPVPNGAAPTAPAANPNVPGAIPVTPATTSPAQTPVVGTSVPGMVVPPPPSKPTAR